MPAKLPQSPGMRVDHATKRCCRRRATARRRPHPAVAPRRGLAARRHAPDSPAPEGAVCRGRRGFIAAHGRLADRIELLEEELKQAALPLDADRAGAVIEAHPHPAADALDVLVATRTSNRKTGSSVRVPWVSLGSVTTGPPERSPSAAVGRSAVAAGTSPVSLRRHHLAVLIAQAHLDVADSGADHAGVLLAAPPTFTLMSSLRSTWASTARPDFHVQYASCSPLPAGLGRPPQYLRSCKAEKTQGCRRVRQRLLDFDVCESFSRQSVGGGGAGSSLSRRDQCPLQALHGKSTCLPTSGRSLNCCTVASALATWAERK